MLARRLALPLLSYFECLHVHNFIQHIRAGS
jgi:hypothetical protein